MFVTSKMNCVRYSIIINFISNKYISIAYLLYIRQWTNNNILEKKLGLLRRTSYALPCIFHWFISNHDILWKLFTFSLIVDTSLHLCQSQVYNFLLEIRSLLQNGYHLSMSKETFSNWPPISSFIKMFNHQKLILEIELCTTWIDDFK